LPLGTANDFARQWGYTADVNSVYKALFQGNLMQVDVIQCNDVPFLTVGGLGVGALLTRDFNWLRQQSPSLKRALESIGPEIYTAMAAATIVGRRSYLRQLEIEASGAVCSGRFSNIFICNQKRLGGQLCVAPLANSSDGLVDILCLRGETPSELIHSLACLRMNKEPKLSERITGRDVTLRACDGKPILMFADGESYVLAPEIKITVHRKAISLLTEIGDVA
jgi:diacylglycerol kinase family enzyme